MADLLTLTQKLSRFIFGDKNERVDIGQGRSVRTLAGIDESLKSSGYLQILVEYPTLLAAQLDYQNNILLKEGSVFRVHSDNILENGLYRITTAGIRKTDFWELYDFFNISENQPFDFIQRETTAPTDDIVSILVDKPLNGQSKVFSFDVRTQVDIRDGAVFGNLIFESKVFFGFNPDGEVISLIETTHKGLGDYPLVEQWFSQEVRATEIDPLKTQFTLRLSIGITQGKFIAKSLVTNLPKRTVY